MNAGDRVVVSAKESEFHGILGTIRGTGRALIGIAEDAPTWSVALDGHEGSMMFFEAELRLV